jgi:beta-galactosidase
VTGTGGTSVGGALGTVSARLVKVINKDWKVINKDWKFIKQDVTGAEATTFADTGWQAVQLPHSFEQPYWRTMFATPPYVGWYRKHITVDQSLIDAKERVFIEFEAVFQYARVYVNGVKVGEHRGGYTGFTFDISASVRAGDNVIAVRVDGSWNAQMAPRAGEQVHRRLRESKRPRICSRR